MNTLLIAATTGTASALTIAAHMIARRFGYRSAVHAWARIRYDRRRLHHEGCVRCGSDLTRYTWIDAHTRDRESHCATCHIVGQRFPGSVCIDHSAEAEWTIGEIEDRLYRYFDALDRVRERRDRRASLVRGQLSEALVPGKIGGAA